MMNKKILLLLLVPGLIGMHNAMAEKRLTLGVKLLGAGWQGDNGSAGNSFNSSEGGQLGFNASFKVDRFYTGLSLQGGEYSFSGSGPDQFTPAGRVATSDVNVTQSDFDLVLGYYVWPQVSLFLDFKAVGNEWNSNNYKQSFSGLGLGASGFMPLNPRWTLYGSLGFIGNGDIKDDDKDRVGDGSSRALELGAVYSLDSSNHINMGIKFRRYNFEYLDDSDQDYTVNALFVGYNHVFDLD